jgi:hypothetical protein
VFNHTQFLNVNTSPQSGADVDPSFGKVTSTRDPRIVPPAVRVVF